MASKEPASKTDRKRQSFIYRLRNREVYGSFVKNVTAPSNKAKLLFGDIPPRLQFHLKTVIEDMGNHILMGMTQCGQFILTYSFTMDQTQTNNRSIYGSSYFKYRLHWWRFRVNAPAVMVAEVPLFENQDIVDVLTIGIAQWPSVSNKILVYGQSFSAPQNPDASEFRKIYITITLNPSLGNCKDCSNVKKSMEENDNWNSGVGTRCLRHGLAVHTIFSVFPPFPPIDPEFALKVENQIIVNAGNSLHVLFVDLEENSMSNDSTKLEDSTLNEELRHKIGAKLASGGYDYKVPVVTNITESRAKNEQSLSDRTKRFLRNIDMSKTKSCFQNSDCDNQCENCKSDCNDSSSAHPCKRLKSSSVSLAISRQACLRQIANQIYDFAESDESCNLKFKWYRRRTIADKMYEFCSDDDDEDTENIHPLSVHFGSNTSLGISRSASATIRARKTCEIDLEDVDRLSVASQASETSDPAEPHLSAMSPLPRCTLDATTLLNRDKCWMYENENECASVAGHSRGSSQLNVTCDKVRPEDTTQLDKSWVDENGSSSNPGQSNKPFSKRVAGTSQLNVTCDSVWLDWETTSLSPRSDVSYSTNGNVECSELKVDSARSFLENLPSMGSSESCSPKCVSPMAVKCYPGSANSKDRNAKTKDGPTLKRFFCREDRLNSFLKHYPLRFASGMDKDTRKEAVPKVNSVTKAREEITQDRWLIQCTPTRFEKRYIEIDEEILSTGTDADDEDGVNYALTLSVHGTGYSQMQAVTNNKVEKLSVPCCVVRQDSLDIEQCSYKVSVIICKCQGYKFRFCNDYDVEIVDVCPLNGDILAVMFLRINADPPVSKTGPLESKVPKEPKDPQQFFETRCLFIWNAKSKACWLEAFTPLVEDTLFTGSEHRNLARGEAVRLRLLDRGFFNVPLIRPIRHFQHLVFDNIRFGPSLQVVEDQLNFIGFFKEPDDVVLGLADDSDYSLSDYSNGEIPSEDEEEDGMGSESDGGSLGSLL